MGGQRDNNDHRPCYTMALSEHAGLGPGHEGKEPNSSVGLARRIQHIIDTFTATPTTSGNKQHALHYSGYSTTGNAKGDP